MSTSERAFNLLEKTGRDFLTNEGYDTASCVNAFDSSTTRVIVYYHHGEEGEPKDKLQAIALIYITRNTAQAVVNKTFIAKSSSMDPDSFMKIVIRGVLERLPGLAIYIPMSIDAASIFPNAAVETDGSRWFVRTCCEEVVMRGYIYEINEPCAACSVCNRFWFGLRREGRPYTANRIDRLATRMMFDTLLTNQRKLCTWENWHEFRRALDMNVKYAYIAELESIADALKALREDLFTPGGVVSTLLCERLRNTANAHANAHAEAKHEE